MDYVNGEPKMFKQTKKEKPSCFGKQDNLSATPEKCNPCAFNDKCYVKTLDILYKYRDDYAELRTSNPR